jgi:hypothetical protein
MGTVTKTFSFASDAEGWASSGGTADTTLGWSASGGNTGGCISSRIFGRNKSADPHWYYVGTWEDMGVPAGATVTNIQLLGFDWRCSEWNVGDNTTQQRLSYLYDSGGTVQIAQLSTDEPTVSGTTAYATISGTIQTVGASYQASNTSVQLYSDIYLRNANNDSAAVTLLMDNFSVEITYTESVAANILTATGELTLTGYAPTVTISDNKVIFTATGELLLEGFAPTVAVTNNINILTSTGELVLEGYTPTVVISNNINIVTSTGELILTGYAPTVDISGQTKYLVTKTGYYITYNNKLLIVESDVSGDILLLQENSGTYTELEVTTTTTPPTFG